MPEAGDSTEGPAAAENGAGRAGFLAAAVLGSLAALVLYLALLAGPGPTLLRDNGLLSSFYDVQGRALLDGRLDVDPAQVSFEGFRMDGETHIYFGLVPTLLRLPVLLITDDLDGRLTQLSMLLSFAVLMAATAQLHWRLRQLVRAGAPWGRGDWLTAFLMQLAVGAGAVPLYLASRAIVYHEAESWGAALSVAGLAATLGIVAAPSTRRIAWAGLLAALALSARFSVGLAPVLALALLCIGAIGGLWAARRGGRAAALVASFGPRTPGGPGARTILLLGCAVLVALALHATVNAARFGTPFGIPIEKQVQSQIEPNRRAALAANDGTIFGLQFVPTTLVQALRPDAVGTVRAFPFIGLPSEPADVIGDVRFDTIEPSLSAVTSMPALALLTLVGVAAFVRRRDLRPVLGLLLASGAGFALTVTIAFVTTRYLADLLPFLVVGGLLGAQALLGLTRRRALALSAVAVLAVIGVVVNGGAGLVSQRLLYDASEAERSDFVRFQDAVDRLLGRRPAGVTAGRELPFPAGESPGDLFVLDRCAGLYVQGLQKDWLAVERTPRAGLHRLTVRFGAAGAGEPETLIAFGAGRERVAVTTASEREGHVFALIAGTSTVERSDPVPVSGTGPVEVVIAADRFTGDSGEFVRIDVDGKRVLTVPTPDVAQSAVTLGADPGGLPPFSGVVSKTRAPARACRTLAAREQ